jgi:hypothetical protein
LDNEGAHAAGEDEVTGVNEETRAANEDELMGDNDEAPVANEDELIGENEEDSMLGYAVDMAELVEELPYKRLGCLAHTLQLLIREVYNSDEYREILQKARSLVEKVRKSSIALEKIVALCGKTVITRVPFGAVWNSTYLMVQRLLEIKDQLNGVLVQVKLDTDE